MAEATANKRKPRSRVAKVFRVIAAIGILLVLSALLITPICNLRWNSYAEQLRQDGQPITFAEIDKLRTELPDDQNNYLLLEPLLGQFERIAQHTKESEIAEALPLLGKSGDRIDFFLGVSSKSLEAMKTFLDQNADTLRELNAVSGIPTGRIPMDVEANPIDLWLPNTAPYSVMAKSLIMQNAVMLKEGNTSDAVHSSLVLSNIAGTLNEHPTLLGRLGQIFLDKSASDTIESTLRVTTIDTEQLRQLEESVTRRIDQTTTKWCFWGERAVFVETCEWSIDGKFTTAQQENVAATPTALVRHNQTKGTQLLSTLVDAADNPDAMLTAAENIETVVAKLSKVQCITRTMVSSYSRSMRLHFRVLGYQRSTRTALAAERFRMDNGHLPESLDQLVPDYIETIPADPFDGAPLKLTTTDKGIIIYSIGDDKTDDSGNVASTQDGKKPTDFGFRLLEAEHRGLVILDTPTEVHTNNGK